MLPLPASTSAISEACHDALLLILGFLGTARDVARGSQPGLARGCQRRRPVEADLLLERPALAATVLPLVDRRLPPADMGADGGRLHPWHPKRVLKKHWRMAQDRDDSDDDDDDDDEEEEEEEDEEEVEQRWRARFRDCYLQLTLTDGDDPMRRPVLTKLFSLSDKDVVSQLFVGAGDENALCLGAVPDYYQGPGEADDEEEDEEQNEAWDMLPRRLEATLSALDLSGAKPKAAHLSSSDYTVYDVDDLPGLHGPEYMRDSFDKLGKIHFHYGFFHHIELFVKDAAETDDDDARVKCKAVAVAAPGQAAHVHFGVRVEFTDCYYVKHVELDAVGAWQWMHETWSDLAWK